MNPLPGIPTVISSAAPASAAVTVDAASSAVSAVIVPAVDVSLSSEEARPLCLLLLSRRQVYIPAVPLYMPVLTSPLSGINYFSS